MYVLDGWMDGCTGEWLSMYAMSHITWYGFITNGFNLLFVISNKINIIFNIDFCIQHQYTLLLISCSRWLSVSVEKHVYHDIYDKRWHGTISMIN